MSWRNQQLIFSVDSAIEVSIDLVDVLEDTEVQSIISSEMDFDDKVDWLHNNAKSIVQSMIYDRMWELNNWASRNNIKIRFPAEKYIIIKNLENVDWLNILRDLEVE